jgi:hypothetical protein
MSLLSRLPRFPGLFGSAPGRGLRLSVLALCAAAAPAAHAQIKLMTNGDSITFGVGASDVNTQCYTAQLGRMLGSAYYTQRDGTGGATLLKNGTVPFWNTQGIRITSEMNPNIIYIMLGTNDSKPVNWIYKDQFVPDYLSHLPGSARQAADLSWSSTARDRQHRRCARSRRGQRGHTAHLGGRAAA